MNFPAVDCSQNKRFLPTAIPLWQIGVYCVISEAFIRLVISTEQKRNAYFVSDLMFGTNRNHPRCGRPPRSILSQAWHIRLKHRWDQWRPSTRTVTETSGRHNARIFTQAMRSVLSDLHRVSDARIEAPFWIGSVVLQRFQWIVDSLGWFGTVNYSQKHGSRAWEASKTTGSGYRSALAAGCSLLIGHMQHF